MSDLAVSSEFRNRSGLDLGMTLAFSAIILVLILTRALNSYNIRNLYHTTDAATRSAEVRAGLYQLLANLIDAETQERGFIVTGHAGFLDPYERDVRVVREQVATLRTLIASEPLQQSDVRNLQSLVQTNIAELDNSITRRRQAGFEAAQQEMQGNLAAGTVENIRHVIGAIDARESGSLQTHASQAQRAYWLTLGSGFTSTGVELSLVIALVFAAVRSGRDRLRAHQAAERLSVTLESIGDGVVVTDRQARIIRLNSVAESLTGWKQDEAVGQALSAVMPLLNVEQGTPMDNPVAKVLCDGVATQLANHTALISRDGYEIPIDDSASPIRTANGEIAGAVMVFRDISERRRMEEERIALLGRERAARAQAERANRTKDEFLVTLSHELRTPLASIIGWSNLLKDGSLPPERARYALEAILRGAEAETHLVDSLLDISRITSGKMYLDKKPIDLAQVVNAAADTIRPSAAAKRIEMQIAAPDHAIRILADTDRIQQVVWNLLSNAVKFTPENGHIYIDLRIDGTVAQLQVRDDGRGIRAEYLPCIFDRFVQDHAAPERHLGLGLGLAIVKALVEAHGGTIHAASAGDGQGSTFTVRWPLVAEMDRVEMNAEIVLETTDAIVGTRVLVVDDDSDSRERLAWLLSSRGAIVQTAAAVTDAMRLIRQKTPDVLLADLEMPGEDGYSLVQELRLLEREAHQLHVPAIAVSAHATAGDSQRTTAVGFDGHIAKPFELAEIVRLVAASKRIRSGHHY